MKKLLIICGGQSTEHIISRMSCTSVLKNINKEKYDITLKRWNMVYFKSGTR